jgi:putative ABC transport system substrate-binding protein
MRRREFLGVLGAAAAWPLAALAQQSGKLPLIGMLVPGTRATHGQWFAALVERLRELSWIEGRSVAFEWRWAEGRTDRSLLWSVVSRVLPGNLKFCHPSVAKLRVNEATT